MSCILHVIGSELNIEDCLANIPLPLDRKYLKGEPKGRNSTILYKSNGFTLLASEHDEIASQISETETFLKNHYPHLKTITARPDVETTVLNFAWFFPEGKNVSIVEHRHFPPELLRLCGELNIGIEVSVYASAGG
jgi:hypothetical protein